jgi:hypothetical protein
MPKIAYIDKRFSEQSVQLLTKATYIVSEYEQQGFDLTVRQLYYQFVSRGWLPESWADPITGSTNNLKSYGKLQNLISDGRLAGLIDWDYIVDRTRNLESNPHWSNPQSIIRACANQFEIDKWYNQDYRLEVWIEKDALKGVISGICEELDIPYFSCRGYTSQSEMWRAAQRLADYSNSQIPIIIHLGDHDPSGIDMTRDIIDRLELFSGDKLKVERIALNRDQIELYNPPPNPAKLSDTRAKAYIAEFGYDSWELDALEPQVLVDLIENTVLNFRDDDAWTEALEKENNYKSELQKVSNDWNNIAK